jgi:hypothetical protein
MSGQAVDHAALDKQITETRTELGKVMDDTSGSPRREELQTRLTTLYQQRDGASADPDMVAKPNPAAEEGEKTEAPVAIDWGPGTPSAAEAAGRASVQSLFGRFGVTAAEGGRLVALARQARDSKLGEEAFDTLARENEAKLRGKWGASFDAKLRAAYHLADVFENVIGHHPDIERAIDNGLWLRPEVLELLADIAERRGVGNAQADIAKMRKELVNVPSGSPRWNELTRALEYAYKHLHGVEET